MPFAFVLGMILKREGGADSGFMIVRVIQLYCYFEHTNDEARTVLGKRV